MDENMINGTVKRVDGDRVTIEQPDGQEVTLQVVRAPIHPALLSRVEEYHAARTRAEQYPSEDVPYEQALAGIELGDAVLALETSGLWLCGCLVNDGGAHRVGCPDHPEGVRGDRL
jgi:hypothetical protein